MGRKTTNNPVCECNRIFNEETLHPQASIIDLSAPCAVDSIRADFYSVEFRSCPCGNDYDEVKPAMDEVHVCGRKYYDYSDGTMTFHLPGDTMDTKATEGTMLIFSPEIIMSTPLGRHISDYTFFHYHADEALHTSLCEQKIVKRCMDNIASELHWGVDRFSKAIISGNIELLLNYCSRFYNRQFITRHEANANALTRTDRELTDYLYAGRAADKGLPATNYIPAKLGMSEAYFIDMLRHETGKAYQEYVALKRVEVAKRMLMENKKSTEDISASLGFCSTACFTSLFRKLTGCTPTEYAEQ